jgi:uncharacterized protein
MDCPHRKRSSRRSVVSVKASPEVQLRLLEVQALDTRLAQLAHRRRTLAERTELAGLEQEAMQLRDRITAAETEVSDLHREQLKADADVESVRVRADRDRERLNSGVGSPKDLENLQHELESLSRRQSELEDVELEIMQRLEDARGALSALEADRSENDTRQGAVSAAIAQVETELDTESAELTGQRAVLAEGIDEGLRTLYEKIRADQSGVGAAALHRGQCGGCRMTINPTELARIQAAAPDELIRCDECRRILVRTAESGI